MIKNIVIVCLLVVVAGTSFWGYQEHKEKNAILINAENTYQRAFHDLSYHVDLLQDKIGNTLAMNSKKSISPALTDVWRITSDAQHDVGQLPLTLLPFNKTEEFLSEIGTFSYQTAVRDLDKEPLNNDEYAKMATLYTQAGDIQKELRKVQYLVIKNNLRWMDVETALASQKENSDNTIIDGFKTVEKKVTGYPENSLNPSFSSTKYEDENYQKLKGKKINKEEAIQIAKHYSGFSGNLETKIEKNGKGANYGFYSVSLVDRETKAEVDMDITKKGGFPIWLINNRDINETKLSLNDANLKAQKFLKDHDFDQFELYESSEYDHIGLFNFVAVVDGVRIYPDSVKLKIALDDGGVIGFSAADFLKTHNVNRKINEASLSIEEAKEKINHKVTIMEERKALIINDLGQETLCYEYLGTIDNDTYRIFINADNGNEEKVEKLKNPEPVYENIL